MQAITLSFFRFNPIYEQVWAFGQMLSARGPLRRVPDIGFHKLLGSGTGEGFTPVPNTAVYAVLAVWPTLDAARTAIAESAVYQRYRDHADEHWTVYLRTTRIIGAWAGETPFILDEDAKEDEIDLVAVLTRATVRPRHVIDFWRHVPNIEGVIRDQPHLLFKMGLGEVPWLHQVTFTIWDSREAMRDFAYRGFHNSAIEDVRAGGWFSEEMFARFYVLHAEGQWEGRDPLGLIAGNGTLTQGNRTDGKAGVRPSTVEPVADPPIAARIGG